MRTITINYNSSGFLEIRHSDNATEKRILAILKRAIGKQKKKASGFKPAKVLAMKRTRGELAGRLMGRALIEMVNLMYQNNTAKHFITGLYDAIKKEYKKRIQANDTQD